ncbi:CCAAT/enhancer-binding protein gamma-like [Brevipalpus obovatus]|uniref:CCAAT/enhancer-binding protein gamma-like n=1 Tax=Brevipalpus obovatus TaxID=246614 RepID=UPI003D9E1BE0
MKRKVEMGLEEDEYSSDSNQDSSEASGSETGRGFGKVNRMVLNKESEEYRKRRERNNQAVKKSRTKTKIKTIETLARVNELKKENDNLKQKILTLSKELNLLKELFAAHVSGFHPNDRDSYRALLCSDASDDLKAEFDHKTNDI